MNFIFDIPSTLLFGEGESRNAGRLLKEMGARKVLLVCDQVMSSLGFAECIRNSLVEAGLDYAIFSEVTPNPTDTLVHAAAVFAAEHQVDSLVAIGGGSIIDSAKAINILLTNGGEIAAYEGVHKVTKPTLPLVMIPTTAGTGSEVTAVTVVTDTERHKKMVIAGRFVGGTLAICDPLLTADLPPAITAATGMDALTHAIEAYISKLASPVSDSHALKAIDLINTSLEEVSCNGNKKARSNLMLGSTMAGMAFNSAMLGLVHSLAHPLSAHYNIAHGVANAVFLPQVMRYNLGSFDHKLDGLAEALGIDRRQPDLGEQVVRRLETLSRAIGIPKFKDLNVPVADFAMLAEEAMVEISTMSNPKQATVADLIHILESTYAEA